MVDYKSSLGINIKRYPWYLFFRDCYFWGPAFFLYFSSIMSLSQVLWLEAVYYLSVAVMEVPSGHISDRLGRKITLVGSSACLAVAYLLFFTGQGVATFALAQVFLAAGFAAASGTDTAFHYESLGGVNRQGDYATLEGRALGFSLRAGAIGALAGGLMAAGQLRWIYAASFAAALVSLVIAMGFIEPQDRDRPERRPISMGKQVSGLMGKALSGRFRFFTLYTLSMTLLLHFPYEFYQPYLERVTESLGRSGSITPAIAGVHLALTMLAGSLFTRFSGTIHLRCKVRQALLGCALFQVVLVGAMALFVHPMVVLLLIARTISRAVSVPLVNAELSPLLERHERSTYLSLQSLLGRLAYGAVLLMLPLGTLFFSDAFHGALVCASGLGLVLWIVLWRTAFPKDASHTCCGNHSHDGTNGHKHPGPLH
jgi:MFS family permease